jgi:predicted MFS family arabinose efflux permease
MRSSSEAAVQVDDSAKLYVADEARSPIAPYLVLSMLAGTTAGMLRALSPIFAIHLGATPAQIGVISSFESFGMAAMTLPAGMLVARFGPRNVYVCASILITMAYCLTARIASWPALAASLCLGGACMPFRIVSVSSSFLERLRSAGRSKAGWYSGSTTIGTLLVGPVLASLLLVTAGPALGYLAIALIFGSMGIYGARVLSSRSRLHTPSGSSLDSIVETLRVLRHPVVSAVCLIEISSGIVFAFFTAFIVVTAIQYVGLSETQAISIRMFEGAVAVFTGFVGGYLVKDRPIVWFYRATLVLIVGGFLTLSVAANYATLVFATLMLGLGLGVSSLVNVMRVSSIDAPKSRASSLQLLSSFSGAFIGALLGGSLTKLIGLHGMFASGAIIYALLSFRWCFGGALANQRLP